MAKHKAIGLLVSQIYSNYTNSIWTGIAQGARSRGYNLITYRGGNLLYDKERGRIKGNAVYENIDFDQIDGLILVSTSIATEIPPEAYEGFCARFKAKPIVSIGDAPDFVPQCLIDNSSGFYNLVTHLVKDHGCRSFAYLGGPTMAKEAVVRYDAFRAALADNQVPFNEELLFCANFLSSQAHKCTQALVNKKIKFDALVAANDDMAISAGATLRELGYRIPEDVKIIGFDDIPNAMAADPPLSTVRQPLYTQAFRSVNMLIDLAEGKAVDREEYIQTMPVIRKSCGCGQSDAASKMVSLKFKEAYACAPKDREKIVADIERRMRHSLDARSLAAVTELVGLFHRSLAEGGRAYLEKLQEILGAVHELNEIDVWQEVLLTVETGFADYLSEDRFPAFRSLVDGQSKLINEKTMQVQSQKYALSNLENRNLREMLQGLGYSYRLEDIHDFMAANFKNRLNVLSGYLVLFTDDTAEQCRLVAGYGPEGRLDLNAWPEPYPAKYLIPHGREDLAAKSYYVCPIDYDDKEIGIIILETGPAAAFIYESLSSQMISSIRGSFLLRKSTEAAENLREWNKKIESLVAPMLLTIRQVTEITSAKMQTIAALSEVSLRSSNKINQTAETIRAVSDKFTEMMGIIKIIDDISTTVKLVSINASIEATHAGQFGAGFQVLAREIGKLSESTRQNADNISQTLRSVIDNVTFSIEASKESAAFFREQETSVNAILDAMKTISDFMLHLDEGSNKILTVMAKA